jgi:hypothetical protein
MGRRALTVRLGHSFAGPFHVRNKFPDAGLAILPVGGNAGSFEEDEPSWNRTDSLAPERIQCKIVRLSARPRIPRSKAAFGGLKERTGEFRVGEKIIFGMRNGNVLIRHSPQGDEVEVGEATLAGLMIDAFFTDKFGDEYPTVKAPHS